MKQSYVCHSCHTTYPVSRDLWKCPCGGLLDLDKQMPLLHPTAWKSGPPTLWRFLDALPFEKDAKSWQNVTLGEGDTPLLPVSADKPNVYVKVDYLMPTLSFKDRGAAVLIAKALELGATSVIADSSGNAGTAVSAYAARAGIACEVFCSNTVSPKKQAQMAAYNATVHTIAGTREDVARAAQQKAANLEEGGFYASHVYNPYFYEGTKTYAYEIYEQLGEAPDTVIVPVGNGTLLLGAYYGFSELLANRLIGKCPKIVAVQAQQCAPLAHAFATGEPSITPTLGQTTIAEGIAIAAPPRATQILEAVRNTDGTFITVSEAQIARARSALAKQGFDVEPTSAATYAAFHLYRHCETETIVIPLCGSGTKASEHIAT
ncbi:MAG: Threonine synthase [Shouchella clausii]|jgi:threonine synthase